MPLGIGADRGEALDKLLDQAGSADLILSTGGVSVGEKDLVQQTLERRGFLRKFWKVAIKPGKPVLFGLLQGKPVLGLPGNPAATAATFELFARPALRLLSGQGDPRPVKRSGILQQEVKGGGNRQTFIWCRCDWSDGAYRLQLLDRQGSGQTRGVQAANALLPIPAGTAGLQAGETAEVILL